jgi:hypothetical protein
MKMLLSYCSLERMSNICFQARVSSILMLITVGILYGNKTMCHSQCQYTTRDWITAWSKVLLLKPNSSTGRDILRLLSNWSIHSVFRSPSCAWWIKSWNTVILRFVLILLFYVWLDVPGCPFPSGIDCNFASIYSKPSVMFFPLSFPLIW